MAKTDIQNTVDITIANPNGANKMEWIILLVIVVVLLVIVAAYYNSFVTLRNRVDNAWAQIDVQLQRRHDLIPNIVESVKGYATHESGTFEKVTRARQMAIDATTVEEKAAAENILSSTLRSLFAVAENYPELKANENFMKLQDELARTEDKLSYSRQSYNDTVMTYNTAIQQFPGVIIAGPTGFKPRTSFEVDTSAKEAPKVQF